MIKMDKKGTSLENMYPAVLTLVLIGIILGIGIFILNEVGKGISADALTVSHEAIVFSDGGISVATAENCQARKFVATSVINASNGTALPTTNYTLSTEGLLTADGLASENSTTVNITYTYVGTLRTASTDPCGVMATTSTGTGSFADWIAVIVVVLAAAIVLGIVMNSFGRGGGSV